MDVSLRQLGQQQQGPSKLSTGKLGQRECRSRPALRAVLGVHQALVFALAFGLVGQAIAAGVAESGGYVSAEQWGSVPVPRDAPESAFRSQRHARITGITVHHQGEVWDADADVSAYLRRLQQWSRRERGWVDVPYHYIVAPDGAVFEGRALGWAGDSNTTYDTSGQVQVMLLGNFQEQRPTSSQLGAATRLLGRLMQTYSLGPERISAHRHHTTQTVCPGENLMTVFEVLRQDAQGLRQDPLGR